MKSENKNYWTHTEDDEKEEEKIPEKAVQQRAPIAIDLAKPWNFFFNLRSLLLGQI